MENVFTPEEYLESIHKQLLATDRSKIMLTREWANQYPNKPGVYLIRDKEEIIYVGETGSIRGRMKDMIDTRNHVIRRTLGKSLFSGITGFAPATSRIKYVDTIEEMLNTHIKENLTVATMLVKLGRKELEEKVFEVHDPIYNQKGLRVTF